MKNIGRALLVVGAGWVVTACSSEDASGGVGSGGQAATGGSASGKGGTVATGGVSAGGLSAGGAASGGTTSGGSANGGSSGGGVAIGGTASGGEGTGGATGGSGGTAFGGAAGAAGAAAAGTGGSIGGGAGAGGAISSGGAVGNATGWKPGIGYACPSIAKPVCNAASPTSYTKNTGSLGTHDPAIFADAACNFYVVASHALLPNKKSTDLVAWSSFSLPTFTRPAWNGSGSQVWASDPKFIDGKYLIYYSNWKGTIPTAQIGLITNTTLDSASPDYRWVDAGLIVDRTNGGNAAPGGSNVNVIDPNLFVDDDGSWWLIYGSYNDGVRLMPINKETGKGKDNPIRPTVITDHLGEGASLIKQKGYYYVFVSRGKCCSGVESTYEVIYARSTSITGPYVTKSGGGFATSTYTGSTDRLMGVGFEGYEGGAGGQQFIQVNGQWYIAYHAYTSAGTNLVVRPIYFDSSGWVTYDCTKAAN